MPEVKSYGDLKVWQRAMDLTVLVYELTRSFPKDEQYGLTSQVRRAVVSVAADIAEGYGRSTKPAYLNFLRISQGSLKETETHLILASRLAICDEEVVTGILSQTDELGRMLRGLIVSLEAHTSH